MRTVGKVISGGQTGVDIAALYAAANYGIPTGGTAPRGFLTERGPRPGLLRFFGLVEHTSPKYPPRTAANIAAADFTLILTRTTKMGRGSELTRDICFKQRKPVFHATLEDMKNTQSFNEVCEWIHRRGLGRSTTVNIAGSRESTSPGIERDAEWALRQLFGALYFLYG